MRALLNLVAICGWSSKSRGFSNSSQHVTFKLSDDFCKGVLGNFHEDWIVSWHKHDCNMIHHTVRAAFDTWQHNSLLSFHETTGHADIMLSASSMPGDDDNVLLGWANLLQRYSNKFTHNVKIAMTVDQCWYGDRQFCKLVIANRNFIYVTFASVWIVVSVIMCQLILRPAKRSVDAILRIVMWSILIAIPLIFIGACLPCLRCYDFQTVLVHEIGHAIGIGHADAGTDILCGCGDPRLMTDNVTCRAFSSASVMFSSFKHSSSSCLSTDDVDAVRSLWGGDCSQPAWCYETVQLSGMYRVSNALVYAFGIAWLLTFTRQAYATYCRKNALPSNNLPSQQVRAIYAHNAGIRVTRPRPPLPMTRPNLYALPHTGPGLRPGLRPGPSVGQPGIGRLAPPEGRPPGLQSSYSLASRSNKR